LRNLLSDVEIALRATQMALKRYPPLAVPGVTKFV
jgi:hypothetical protein